MENFDLKGVQKMSYRYDVFLSSPMSAFRKDEDYKKDRDAMLRLKKYLENQKNFNIYYAGEHISSSISFENELVGHNDFEAIENSRCFIMFYPESIVSSVLVEAGYALALKKPSVYFVHNKENLPFLLREAHHNYPNVQVFEYTDLEQVLGIMSSDDFYIY
jgi:nucleoside 2-deoxyribosyltransferase